MLGFSEFYVGMTRFELAASSSRTKRATGLRYIPNPIFESQKYRIFKLYDILFEKFNHTILSLN